MSEEIKEYLKRVDELELKLTGDDKDTFQWVLFGYNECARILEETEQENQQLKEQLELYENGVIYDSRVDKLENVLDEIREYSLDLHLYDNESLEFKISNELLQILDKVGSNE